MQRFLRPGFKAPGLSPGTLIHVGERRVEKVAISYLDYGEHELREGAIHDLEECKALRETPGVSWIDVNGIHDVTVIGQLGACFGLHDLLLEDILNTGQRPKAEDHGDYIYVVVKMLSYDDDTNEIASEQVSIILGSDFVISFQEREADVFDPVRERIRSTRGRIRGSGSDYLAYALVDSIVDNYFIMLEKIGEELEEVEEKLLRKPDPKITQDLHRLRRELIFLRKSVWPLREAINSLEHSESPLIHESTRIFLRDVYDHTIQIVETIESYREIASGMLDLYLSLMSNRMNEIMKVLTIIATIFIPLTLFSGIYGMNFKYMPELEWRWGYPAALGLMAMIASAMLFFFRRKKWL